MHKAFSSLLDSLLTFFSSFNLIRSSLSSLLRGSQVLSIYLLSVIFIFLILLNVGTIVSLLSSIFAAESLYPALFSIGTLSFDLICKFSVSIFFFFAFS